MCNLQTNDRANQCWCDTHPVPPFKNSKDRSAVIDRRGDEYAFYPDVPAILVDLKERGIQIAAASRTCAPDIAQDMLQRIHIAGRPAIELFDVKVWGVGSKVKHFKKIHQQTGIDYSRMVFYDDEIRNADVDKTLGAHFVLIERGVNWSDFQRGIDEWRSRVNQ